MRLGLAISLISAGVIGYEILLVRLLSIIQWHHFAYMIISLALLGFGASGTFLTLTRGWLVRKFDLAFISSAVLFALTAVGSFVLAQHLPFNPLELLWNRSQLLYLIRLNLILAVPFFCAANCIGLALSRFRERIHLIYRFDLMGAGSGALGMILALMVMPPTLCLRLLGALGLGAAALRSSEGGGPRSRAITLTLLLGGAFVVPAWPDAWLVPQPSPYKGLSLALRVPGAEVVGEHSGPLGLLSVVRSPSIPFRHAPGLSLNCASEPPEQLGVFIDGDSMTPITRNEGDPETLAYLDCLPASLPYHLLEEPRVLVLGAGGGTDVLMARYYKAQSLTAVELNPQIIELVRRVHVDFAGRLYEAAEVEVHAAEARGFVAGSHRHYDLIQVTLLDSFSASAAGAHALNETYVYTVEALRAYLRRLAPGGILCITRWLKVPPRDSLKLFGTAVVALEATGVAHPEARLALIRSWKTTSLLVKNGVFTRKDIDAIRTFCQRRSFDVAYYPDMPAAEANRHNLLDRPYLYEGAKALLDPQRREFLRRYKFYIEPATDDRPYFFHFFKWATLREILKLKGRGGLPLVEWTYPILILTLVQAVFTSFALILLPLWVLRGIGGPRGIRARVTVYFLALGLAFLFIEIAFIQKFILFLSHPLYAIAVVLSAFLTFAGLGSGYASRLTLWLERFAWPRRGVAIVLAAAGIAVFSLIYIFLLPSLFHRWMPLPDIVKIVISIALISPLAFCMGMPFPLGLARVAAAAGDLIPWAWGINGCASVLSAILATLLAIHFGFVTVVVTAVILYSLAALAFMKPLDSR